MNTDRARVVEDWHKKEVRGPCLHNAAKAKRASCSSCSVAEVWSQNYALNGGARLGPQACVHAPALLLIAHLCMDDPLVQFLRAMQHKGKLPKSVTEASEKFVSACMSCCPGCRLTPQLMRSPQPCSPACVHTVHARQHLLPT